MRTAKIYAAHALPIARSFVSGESHFPTRCGVKLVEHEFFAELFDNRFYERGNVYRKIIFAKVIHSRHIHKLVIAHYAAAHCRLRGKVILVQNVPRYQNAVLFAPFLIRNGEIFYKQLLLDLDKVVSLFAKLAFCTAEPQKRQSFFYFIPLALFKFFKQRVGIRYLFFGVLFLSSEPVKVGISMRFVGENALYDTAEQLAERFIIFFVRQFYKTVGRLGVHRVGISITVIETVLLHVIVIEDENALAVRFVGRLFYFAVLFDR